MSNKSALMVDAEIRVSDMPTRLDISNIKDQNAYVTFLEIQLERVSQTCMQQQQNNVQLKEMWGLIDNHNEKITNLTRLVKLLQSFSDGQESDLDKINIKLQAVEKTLSI